MLRITRVRVWCWSIVLLVALSSCGGDGGGTQPTGLSISMIPSTLSLSGIGHAYFERGQSFVSGSNEISTWSE